MRGQEAVLCALGHGRFLLPTRILSEGTRNILQAMETHGARRLVCDTSLGIGPAVARFATPLLRTVPDQTKRAGDASQNRESSPAGGMERETGFEPATLSLGS